ncbi:hypothetical protein VTI74DRAFT_8374 [Chaetomium olivicolor]
MMTLVTPDLLSELIALYTSPSRHYHSLSHIKSLLNLLSTHRAHFSDAAAVEAAIWYHDAVYDPQAAAPSNEVRSAELAGARLANSVEPKRLEWIRKVIVATATHALPEGLGCKEEEGDARLFLDMDLSILGADEDKFDEYEAAVRKEYESVGEEMWRAGRAAVLKGFLQRGRIYQSELFRGLYEEKARANMRRSLEGLGVGSEEQGDT